MAGAVGLAVVLLIVLVVVARGDGGGGQDVATEGMPESSTTTASVVRGPEPTSSITTTTTAVPAHTTTTAQPPVATTSTIQANDPGPTNGPMLPTAHLDSTRRRDDGLYDYTITVTDSDGWMTEATEWFAGDDQWQSKQWWGDPRDCHAATNDGDLPTSTQTFEIYGDGRPFDVQFYSAGCDGADVQRVRQTMSGAVP